MLTAIVLEPGSSAVYFDEELRKFMEKIPGFDGSDAISDFLAKETVRHLGIHASYFDGRYKEDMSYIFEAFQDFTNLENIYIAYKDYKHAIAVGNIFMRLLYVFEKPEDQNLWQEIFEYGVWGWGGTLEDKAKSLARCLFPLKTVSLINERTGHRITRSRNSPLFE